MLHHFPNIYEKLKEIEDYPKKRDYELSELILACISMFLFKKGSRNEFNNEREEKKFKRNYQKIFKVRLPHMDTVDTVLRQIEPLQLEKLKTELVKGLIEKKVVKKYRFLGTYYRVAIDGSHVMNVNEGHCEHCLHRTSKKTGDVTYFHNVLEAKLICENGFCISLCTEWIENSEEYDKQDCEQKAFKRLAKKLKEMYPRLCIIIIGDALYPNQSFFQTCKDYEWSWMVTFKDGNLPTVWEEVIGLQKLSEQNVRQKTLRKEGKEIRCIYKWMNHIDYKGFQLNWFECVEDSGDSSRRFVYVSSKGVNYYNIVEMVETGRMRWKIENEGFNIQKNNEYGLGHKYSRVSMTATKNYYQCMQIAHMINQLFELSSLLQPLLIGKTTIKHLWIFMLGELRHNLLDLQIIEAFLKQKIQLRYGG